MISFSGISRFSIIIAALSLPVHPAGEAAAGTHTIGYLGLSRRSAEDSAAVRWLSSVPGFRISAMAIDGGLPDLAGIDVLWVHIPDSASFSAWRRHLPKLSRIRTWYEGGGRFLFTGLAAMIPHETGIEPAAPTIEAQDIEDDWLFDQKGFQGYRPFINGMYGGSHPIFDGLFGGTFTWDGSASHRLWTAGYSGESYPAAGKVAAVEKSYITINAGRRLVIEYDNGKGRGIAAGGFLYFHPKNNRREAMERFLSNALRYAAGDSLGGLASYWTPSDLKPRPFDIPRPLLDSLRARCAAAFAASARTAAPSGRWSDNETGLLIARDSATKNFFDVAGPGVLVMGKESGGIDEIWTHPFRLLRDYRAGIVSGDSVLWLDRLHARIEVRPESFTRFYRTPAGDLREIVFAASVRPVAVVRYEFTGSGPLELAVTFRSDLRLMWPYDSPATGSIRYGADSATGALILSDEAGRSWGAFGADAPPVSSLTGQFDSVWRSGAGFSGRSTDADQVMRAARYLLEGGSRRPLTLAMAGNVVAEPAVTDLCEHLLDPAGAYGQSVRMYDRLFESSAVVRTPDPEFNDLFRWALVGADRFFVTTPGVGTGFLAGYSTTARGWDGAQKISGRPGYGWYFGRDAEWTGFAVDDCGNFPQVASEIELLGRYQDGSGKIFHEISTSGSVHYDASDATPLYILLAAHHLRASGDTGFIRAQWPRLKRAMEYLYSTDTDGDGLIENTGQGHGWVEGGKLYPVHTEFYLAGAWCRALLDAAYLASHAGEPDLAGKYRRDGERVREILNRDFWNPETRFFNFGKLADGRYNPEPTVLPATVMYYGLLEDGKAKEVLEQYAGSGFTSDWGVRIVSSSSPLFSPQGYHYGSVWPLFTGWTALAEYEYGNSTQGFTHVLNNMYIKNHWALGFVEEVMNGAVYQPSGVCPHQCWSETNILHPAITGMIGWKPDAPAHSAALRPRFPVQWDSVGVRNLRIGGSVVNFGMVRGKRETRYTFDLASGGPLTISFAPELPAGMEITRAVLDGREMPPAVERRRGLIDPPVGIVLRDHAELRLEHTGGIGVVPAMPRPEPGDSSTGCRIISAAMKGSVYEVVVEGRPGTTAQVEMMTFDRTVTRAGNARIAGAGRKGTTALEVEFPPAAAPYVRTTVGVSIEGR